MTTLKSMTRSLLLSRLPEHAEAIHLIPEESLVPYSANMETCNTPALIAGTFLWADTDIDYWINVLGTFAVQPAN